MNTTRTNKLKCLAVLALTACSGIDLLAADNPEANRHLLRNISTRVRVQTDARVLIGGFVIEGTAPKDVIVRAIGPSIRVNGVPLTGRLADPTLELFAQGSDVPIATNDNWKDTQQAAITATSLPPANDLEAAIVRTLNPGSYTAVMRGKNGGTGVGVVEVYDLSSARDPWLANISSRGHVGAGDDALIGGIIAAGGPDAGGAIDVVVRAIGPSLENAGVPDRLANPTLTLFDTNGTVIGFNDNWDDDQSLELQESGLTPPNGLESAIVASLTAGNYTAVVSGANGGTGIALVEVYDSRRGASPTF